MARKKLTLKTPDGDKVPRRGRPPATDAGDDRAPLRFKAPPGTASALRKAHADTFPQHMLQFGPWLLKGVCAHYGVPVDPPGKPGPKGRG